MSQCASAQFWFIIENETLTKLYLPPPIYKNELSQTGSKIFVTGHMRGSGATTSTCK